MAERPVCIWCGKALWYAALTHAQWRCGYCKGVTFNPRKLSFWSTEVSEERTFFAVAKLFDRFKPIISSYSFAKDADSGRAGVEFVVRARFAIEEPAEDKDGKPTTKTVWQESGLRMRLLPQMPTDPKLRAQRWRLVMNWLENTLEAIAIGAIRAEEAFLACAIGSLSNGQEIRLGDAYLSRLPRGDLRVPMFQEQGDITILALPAGKEE